MLEAIGGRNFILELASRFRDMTVVPVSTTGYIGLTGTLNLSHESIRTAKSVPCELFINEDWIQRIPFVKAPNFTLVEKSVDWHNFANGFLCFELEDHWRDWLSTILQRDGAAATARVAAEWLANSTASLLYRHYLSKEVNKSRWSPSWEGWSHGQAGIAEYHAMKHQRAM
jgi:hypothetical protein